MTLEVKNLNCVRGGRPVFAGLGVRVAAGELVVVRGPNGSGKSSLLRLVAGFLQPASGDVLWDGTPISEDRPAHGARTSYVGHLDAVKPVLTVEENLLFWAGLESGLESGLGQGPTVNEGRIAAALEQLGLAGQADLPAGYLSAGQKRRLNLARLAVCPRALWLLDEPTATLDDRSAKAVAEMIGQHCAGGGMALVATHLDLGLDLQSPTVSVLDLDQYLARRQLELVP